MMQSIGPLISTQSANDDDRGNAGVGQPLGTSNSQINVWRDIMFKP